MRQQYLGLLALLSTAVIWGITLPLMKVNLEVFPPFSLAFGRFFIASALAVCFINFSSLKLRDFLHISVFAVFGMTVHIGLLLNGLAKTSSVDAVFILSLAPVLTSLVAVFAIRERIAPLHITGVLLAFVGGLMYVVYPYFFGGKIANVSLIGDMLILGAVISGSIYTVGSKKLFETYTPSHITAVSFLAAAMSFFPLAGLEYLHNPSWTKQIQPFHIISLLFLGVFAAFLAYWALEYGLSKVAVHINETISYLSQIIAVLVATLFLGETLNPAFWLSVSLILIGIVLVSYHHPKTHPHHYHHRLHKL